MNKDKRSPAAGNTGHTGNPSPGGQPPNANLNKGSMERVLKLMAERKGSDVILSANVPILIKVNGQMVPLTHERLSPSQPRQLLAELLTPQQLEELDDTHELNVGLPMPGLGLFRLSAFKQRGSIAAVFRWIPPEIPPLESLRLPESLGNLALEARGLILLVGATGNGKSTTLAAMINHRNHNTTSHILTIEDPIEFMFTNSKSVINQREVGRDVDSLQIGLRNAMRQAPDCIMIGEIRDRETMTAALSYALSGHLVMATLHGNNSYHALGRILSFYTPESRPAMLADLSAGLKAVVSQRLMRSFFGTRIPTVEVLLNTKLVSELIEQGNFPGVKEAMERSIAEGSQTFEQDIARLITQGVVNREEGLHHADSPTNLLWRLQNDNAQSKRAPVKEEEAEIGPSFTEITLDVVAPDQPPPLRRPPTFPPR
jgi:twitching motility protein PilU